MSRAKSEVDLLLVHASELITCSGGPRGVRGDDLAHVTVLNDAAVAIAGDRIAAVGPTADIAESFAAQRVINASGGVVSPGLVDAHSHLVHAGSRHDEWEARMLGKPTGLNAGIWSTVTATRAARSEALTAAATRTLDTMLAHGTTTLEAKTGYALNREGEIRLLDITAGLRHPLEVVTTFLGAHMVPREFADNREGYVDLIIDMLAEARARAEFCDVSCDPTGFTPQECRRIADAASQLGFKIRVHADQTGDAGGAQFAASVNAGSADHLEAASQASIAALAASDTVAILMPSVTFHMPDPTFDAARWAHKLRDSGTCLAIASDFNPGSAPTPSLQDTMRIAARLYHLSYADIWHMVTINPAHSLGRANRIGSIEVGKQADLVIWDVPCHGMVIHQFGANLVRTVIKSGRVIEVPRLSPTNNE